ncbi:hypothetical protein EYF80_022268 [Liparis tanakae]|uniref:Uncharacterized protein n=1 Tax=Liparis tanakae TaxID=230148 RepID=A0A4Z2HRM5_9TELE|nr:hypothetical protein EYF80_022268 [Liparis tanakae]
MWCVVCGLPPSPLSQQLDSDAQNDFFSAPHDLRCRALRPRPGGGPQFKVEKGTAEKPWQNK